MSLPDAIWIDSEFREYADHCRRNGLCNPWHPYIGTSYGSDGHTKFVYCGGSAWWDSDNLQPQSLEHSRLLTSNFVENGDLESYSTPFWRLFDRLGGLIHPGAGSRRKVADFSAWTNLSKTGLVGQSAPPDSDAELRNLDTRQLKRELTLLQPDILVCVSGTLVPSTGHAMFDGWDRIAGLEATTESTWIRRSPWGGSLLWTMHPAYKSESWNVSVEHDLKSILAANANDLSLIKRLDLGARENQ